MGIDPTTIGPLSYNPSEVSSLDETKPISDFKTQDYLMLIYLLEQILNKTAGASGEELKKLMANFKEIMNKLKDMADKPPLNDPNNSIGKEIRALLDMFKGYENVTETQFKDLIAAGKEAAGKLIIESINKNGSLNDLLVIKLGLRAFDVMNNNIGDLNKALEIANKTLLVMNRLQDLRNKINSPPQNGNPNDSDVNEMRLIMQEIEKLSLEMQHRGLGSSDMHSRMMAVYNGLPRIFGGPGISFKDWVKDSGAANGISTAISTVQSFNNKKNAELKKDQTDFEAIIRMITSLLNELKQSARTNASNVR